MRVYATAPTMTARVTAKIGSARAVCCFSACASDAFPSAVRSFCELPENMIYSCCPLSIVRLEGARRLLCARQPFARFAVEPNRMSL